MTITRIASGPEREGFLPLLLLADESEEHVRSYYQQGDLYALWATNGDRQSQVPLGIVLAVPAGEDTAMELKAVAVAPDRQGQGIGRQLLTLVLNAFRAQGVRRVVAGTGNSGIGQLAFYQKAGFRLSHVERDFFTPARGYAADLQEHGIPLRDMVWMEQTL